MSLEHKLVPKRVFGPQSRPEPPRPKQKRTLISAAEDQKVTGVGPDLPPDLRQKFMAAIDADDLKTLVSLLNTHFTDRTSMLPNGIYRVHLVRPMLYSAARQNCAELVKALLYYPLSTYKFVAEAAFYAEAKESLQVLLDDGWDPNKVYDNVTGRSFMAEVMLDFEEGSIREAKPDMIAWLRENSKGKGDEKGDEKVV